MSAKDFPGTVLEVVFDEFAFADVREQLAGVVDDPKGIPLASGRRVLALGQVRRLAVLEGGTQAGLPSVVIGLELPDGSWAVGETTARAFVRAADAVRSRHPVVDADA